MEVRTRYAPSPTGFMHVGNLRTALYEYLIAKSNNGKFILRIEDTDQGRLVDGAENVIYKTLKTVGLKYDEGPDIGGNYGPYIQSQRMNNYRKYADMLLKQGKAYYCFCSKERLNTIHEEYKKNGEFAGGYDRHCRGLSNEEVKALLDKGVPYVIRQKMPTKGVTSFDDAVFGHITVENSELDDQIIIKADGYPTYNFANVIDDHLMNITHVVRGCEYLSSTPKYNLLYKAFNWEIPTYIHLPLIMGKNEDGTVSKLSKRHGATGFQDLINEGYLAEAITNYIAFLGWCPKDSKEIMSLEELVKEFSISGISKSPAIFDYEKLNWFNTEYIKAMKNEDFISISIPYIKKVIPEKQINLHVLADILKPRVIKLTQIPDMIKFLNEIPDYSIDLFINKKSKTNTENSLNILIKVLADFENMEYWTYETIHNYLISLAQKLGVKNGTIMWPVRIAISGLAVTPGGAIEILEILGKDKSLKRLKMGINKLKNE